MEHIEQTGFVNEPINPVRPVVTTYFDEAGWLSVDPIEGRSTTAPVPSVNLAPGYAWNYVGAPGREWVAIERNPAPVVVEPAPAAPRYISVGGFFDRFGAQKWPILSSTDVTVQALVKDCTVRTKTGINLDAPDVLDGVKLLQAKGFAVTVADVIDAPVRESERP